MGRMINYNGTLVNAHSAIITADARSWRYGDGLFETMRSSGATIALATLHFDRLFAGMRLLRIPIPSFFTPAFIQEQITSTLLANEVTDGGRVRLSVFRVAEKLSDSGTGADFCIEAWPIAPPADQPQTVKITLYTEILRHGEAFANLKSNNYLASVMGAIHAGEAGVDDCLLINHHGRICESTIANVFWVKAGRIYTPPLSEGCVAGVMRRHLLTALPAAGLAVAEQAVTVEELMDADEIFLTNAISGLRSVLEWDGKTFECVLGKLVYRSTFWAPVC